jgi:hypothetical protein
VQAELAEAGNTVDAKLVIFFLLLLLPRLINGAALFDISGLLPQDM